MGSHRQDGRDDVTMKVVVIVLSMSVIATAFTIDDPRLPLRRQRRHPSLFSELLDYGFLDIFQDPNEVYSGTTQEPEFGIEAKQARSKREPGLLDGLLDIFKDPSDASSSYKEPEPTYEVPESPSSYEVPQAPESYEVPQATSYEVPQSPNYAAPETTYKEPEKEPGLLHGLLDIFKDPNDAPSSYEVPQATSYEVPQATSYDAPESSYKEPSYQAPASEPDSLLSISIESSQRSS